MGLSSNQARFLSLTSRQVDLERRIQQICQRRLRLASELENLSTSYNNKISDRKLYLNTAKQGFSGVGSFGTITHNNLNDNPRYEALTIDNLYDNGYHVFVDDQLYDMMRTATGATTTAVSTAIPFLSVDDWYDDAGPQYWRVTGVTANPSSIVAPTPAESGTVSGSSTTAPVAGTPNTTPVYSAWVAGATVVNPTTGQVSQTFTRTGSVDSLAGSTTTTSTSPVVVNQLTMANLTAAGNDTIGGVSFNKFTYTDYKGDNITTYAIGDVDNAQAVSQLNALTTLACVSNQNFILMRDVDMSSVANWGIIKGLDNSTFDGNMHKISNLTINAAAPADNNIGMFGAISYSVVKNLNIENEVINVTTDPLAHPSSTMWTGSETVDQNRIGGIAASCAWTANVENCHITGLDMNITGPGTLIGGIVGCKDSGTLFGCSAQGSIDISGEMSMVGGLLGGNFGSGGVIYSSADVDINGIINTAAYGTESVGPLAGNYGSNYCYASGLVNGAAQSYLMGIYFANSLTTRDSANGYYGTPGAGVTPPTTVGVYDQFGSWTPDASATWNTIKDATVNIGGTNINVWNPNGTINQAVINTKPVTTTAVSQLKATTTWTETITKTDNPGVTYQLAEYVNNSFDQSTLEARLRDGSVKIAKHADEFTQEVITVTGSDEKFEYVDWRTIPIISDELYKGDDVEAEDKYDRTIEEINAQDKKLQLEQTSVEVEYKAISSERESVKKILDQNAQSSFKYFS